MSGSSVMMSLLWAAEATAATSRGFRLQKDACGRTDTCHLSRLNAHASPGMGNRLPQAPKFFTLLCGSAWEEEYAASLEKGLDLSTQ